MSTLLDREDQQQVIACVRAGLAALERGDDAGFRAQVDQLIGWRTLPLVQGLVRLARELGHAMGDGDPAAAAAGSLPEACARLEHAVQVSEDASHRTMDLIDEVRGLLATMPASPGTAAGEAAAGIRVRLSEMTAAQGYQDLTGQIIRRVVDIVRCVHQAGGFAEPDDAPPLQLPAGSAGFGPSVAGVDPTPADQDGADELLSSLGL